MSTVSILSYEVRMDVSSLRAVHTADVSIPSTWRSKYGQRWGWSSLGLANTLPSIHDEHTGYGFYAVLFLRVVWRCHRQFRTYKQKVLFLRTFFFWRPNFKFKNEFLILKRQNLYFLGNDGILCFLGGHQILHFWGRGKILFVEVVTKFCISKIFVTTSKNIISPVRQKLRFVFKN